LVISLFKFPHFIKILLTKKIATLIFLHEKYKLKQITRQESEGWSCGAGVLYILIQEGAGGGVQEEGGGVAGSHWDGGLNIQSTPRLSLRWWAGQWAVTRRDEVATTLLNTGGSGDLAGHSCDSWQL